MKNLTSILTLVAVIIVSTANANDPLKDLIKRHSLAKASSSFKTEQKYVGNEYVMSYNGYDWDSSTKISYDYTATGDIKSTTTLSFNGYDWDATARVINTYNEQGNLTEELRQSYTSYANRWENSGRTIYMYNSHGDQSKYMDFTFDTYSRKWTLNYGYADSIVYNYDGKESMSTTWSYNYGSWELSTKMKADFDANGNYSSLIYYEYNGYSMELKYKYIDLAYTGGSFETITGYTMLELKYNNQWEKVTRYSSTISNNGLLIEELYESWLDMKWVPEGRSTTAYDTHQNMTKSIYDTWDEYSNVWSIEYGNTYTYKYDADGNKISMEESDYSYYTYGWEKTGRHYYEYKVLTGIANQMPFSVEIDIYPNPATEYINIRTSATITDKLIVNVVDFNGRVVKNETINQASDSHINISDLSNGVYFVNITSGKSQITQRIVKQ